ncbi:MAG: hypothetical protein ACLGI6_10565 [Gammaproteobacteria bacterium]
MFTRLRQFTYGTLAAAALAAAPAQADTTATTTTEFSYQLVDLNPNDNITPWITFEYQQATGTASALTGLYNWDPHQIHGLGTVDYTTPYGHASATVGTDSYSATATMQAGVTGNAGVAGSTFLDTKFTLSPGTRLVFKLIASVALSPPEDHAAYGGVTFTGSLESPGPGFEYSSFSHYLTSYQSEHYNLVESLTTFDQERSGYFRVGSTANVTEPPVVPEPDTCAMLLGGLLLLGLRARKLKG